MIALRRDGIEVVAPQLDAAPVAALLREGSTDRDAYLRALDGPVAQGLDALAAARPDVVVGSSFGAAVLARMLLDARYGDAPAVMLAGAGVRLAGATTLPAGRRVLLVHGRVGAKRSSRPRIPRAS